MANDTVNNCTNVPIVLKQIADALGLSPAAFYSADPKDEPAAEAYDLLRIWREIDSPQARQRLLNFARVEAARCRGFLDDETS